MQPWLLGQEPLLLLSPGSTNQSLASLRGGGECAATVKWGHTSYSTTKLLIELYSHPQIQQTTCPVDSFGIETEIVDNS